MSNSRPDRYEFHDLIRLYATDQAEQHERPADREAAVRRVLDWYLHAAVSADNQLLPQRRGDYLSPYSGQRPPPEFHENAEAVAWFDREYESLRSLTAWAATNRWAGHAWRIVLAMTAYIDTTLASSDGAELCKVAIRAAEIARDEVGLAYSLNLAAIIGRNRDDSVEPLPYLHRALDLFSKEGHTRGEMMVLGSLALTYGQLGDHENAEKSALRALKVCERLGDQRGTAINLSNLGLAYTAAGKYHDAVEVLLKAHDINARLGETASDSVCHLHLGSAYAALGDYEQAIPAYERSAELNRQLGNRRAAAFVQADLGRVLATVGRLDAAMELLEQAMVTLTDLGDPRATEVENLLAELRP